MHRQIDSVEALAASAAKKETKYGMKVAHLFKGGKDQTLPHILSNRSDQSSLISASAPKLNKPVQIVVNSTNMPKLPLATSPRGNQLQHFPRLVVGPAVAPPEQENTDSDAANTIDRLHHQISKLKQTIQMQKELLSDKSYQIQLMSQEISMLRMSSEKLALTNSDAVNQAKVREKEHLEQNKRLNATIAKLMREKEQALQYLMHYQIQNGTLDDPAKILTRSTGTIAPRLDIEFLNTSTGKAFEESSSGVVKEPTNMLKKHQTSEEKTSEGRIRGKQEILRKAADMADHLEQQAEQHMKRRKPYESGILNSRSEEHLNNSSIMSRDAVSVEVDKHSKRNSPHPSKRMLVVDEISPNQLSVEKSPRLHKTSQISKPRLQDKPFGKQAVDPITTAICLQLGRDSVNLILNAASNRYSPVELVDTLRDLIKNFQKAFRAGFGEIVLFNMDFMNLVLETSPTNVRKLREVLEDKTPILLIRPGNNRDKHHSGGIESEVNSLHTLCNELTYLKVEHKPHIKNGCFYLPLVTSFGTEESRVVGVLTMGKFGRAGGFEYGGTAPAEEKDVLGKLQKAPILKDLYGLVSQFFTVLTTDLKRHRAQMDAERAAKICKFFALHQAASSSSRMKSIPHCMCSELKCRIFWAMMRFVS